MIVADDDKGGIRFAVPYHYEKLARSCSAEASLHRRTKRLAQVSLDGFKKFLELLGV